MFYVNNKQVLGMFLNGKNYNYLAYGFGKIIPENRSAQFAYINLAGRYLSQYRVTYGNIQSGYDNFPVARLDYPVNGVFHSPLTYFYSGNIVPTKNVPVYINNGYCALENALVYNDISINGNIVYFAANSDFQGHNVNIHPENFRSSSPYFNGTVMDNCSNFTLHSGSRFSKSSQVALYDCKKFIGWFNFFGDNDGTRFPGFRGFLHTCRDGVFSFNLMNMRGGGSDGSVTNYYNFSCISNCNNIKLNINGSPWQAWVHPNCYSSNCNINTRYIIPGFGHMNHCNFNIYLPSNANVEKSTGYSLLSNSSNCKYNLNALGSNLYQYRSVAFFDNLNNCNLNLLVNNAVKFSDGFGGYFNNCNIIFDNIKGDLLTRNGWWNLYNCNISGNVISASSAQGFLERCDGLKVNLSFVKSRRILPILRCNNIKGNIVAGNVTYVNYSSYLNLNVSMGSLKLINVEHSIFNSNGTNANVANLNNCKFEIYNSHDFTANGVSNSNFNMRDSVGNAVLKNLNNVDFVERGGANYTVTNLDNCRNSWISANTVSGTIENAYNMRLELVNNNAEFTTWRVDKCEITGFPTSAAYTTSCTFNTSISQMTFRWNSNNGYVTWNNIWPHATPRGSEGWNTWYRTKAGLRSVDNFSRCCLIGDNGSLLYYGGSETFNKINNMQTDIKTFYNGIVTANLPNYNMNIKLNVDCSTLNLGIFQAGPPHGFQNATVSANDIYAKGDMPNAYVQVNCDTKIYCENYCNVCFSPYVSNINSALQPVILINNYDHYNTGTQSFFKGGITRIGCQSTRTGPISLSLNAGAFVFINNAVLARSYVRENSVLFLGSNVSQPNGITVESGGLIVNKENWGSHASEIRSRIDRGHLAWNVWDSGPWGSMSLLDFCTNV